MVSFRSPLCPHESISLFTLSSQRQIHLSSSVYLSPFFLSSTFLVLRSLLLSLHCIAIIFPQKPLQASFVKAAQYMNFTLAAHSLLLILPLTTVGSLFPFCPTHMHRHTVSHMGANTYNPAWPQKSMRAQTQTLTILLTDEYRSMQRIQNTDEMPQIKDVLMSAWCFI